MTSKNQIKHLIQQCFDTEARKRKTYQIGYVNKSVRKSSQQKWYWSQPNFLSIKSISDSRATYFRILEIITNSTIRVTQTIIESSTPKWREKEITYQIFMPKQDTANPSIDIIPPHHRKSFQNPLNAPHSPRVVEKLL